MPVMFIGLMLYMGSLAQSQENDYVSGPNSRDDYVKKADQVYPLLEPTREWSTEYTYQGKTYSLDEYFKRNRVKGFLVLHGNQIIIEKYFNDGDQNTRYMSQSVSKSIVSILVGVAVEEGLIKSVDDPITKYLPYLSESGYSNNIVKNILQMSTGVDYEEDYGNPQSEAARLGAAAFSGSPSFKDYIKSMKPTDTPPGTKFKYQSVSTQVLGILLETVTGKPLNEYAQEKLWKKIGTQKDAFFFTNIKQTNTCAFACFNATLRDYGRVGLMMLQGGQLGEERVVSRKWVHDSTTPDAPYLEPGNGLGPGYAYQWWVPEEGVFRATGIFGQAIYVDPARHVVIVQTSNWPEPFPLPYAIEQGALLKKVASDIAP
jgi:CubicO group peptidase (beta-lactamase class C family)